MIRSSHLRLLALCAVLLPLFGVSTFARAQEDVEQVETESQAPAAPEIGYPSPAEAVRAVIEGVLEHSSGGLDRAARALDLSWLAEAEREVRGRELAETLKNGVFDKLGQVDYSELPSADAPELTDGRHLWDFRSEAFGFDRLESGSWVFDKGTVREIEGLARKLSEDEISQEVIRGWPFLKQTHYRIRARLPESLKARAFILENWQWIGLLVLVFLGVVADRVVRFLAKRLANRIAKSKRLVLDPDVLSNFERPFGILVTAWLFLVLLPIIDVPVGIADVLDIAVSFILTVAGIWSGLRLVDVVCGYLTAKARQTSNKFDDMLVPLMRRTLKILVALIGLVFIASRLSEDVTTILAGLSIGSLAVGFAAKDSIENLFGTFTVLMDKPFQLGDWITVGEIDGTVEEVGFRSTRIRTFYNSLISVPNSRFISAHVDNYGERRFRRVKTMLSLTYDTPPAKIEAFCEAVRELIRQHPYTRKDVFYVYLNEWSASSIDVLLYAFLRAPDWGTELREKHRLFADILHVAERLGVSFAFPTQTLHMAKPEDLEHPDTPATPNDAIASGRSVAEEVAKSGLAGLGESRPIAFDPKDRDSQTLAPPQE